MPWFKTVVCRCTPGSSYVASGHTFFEVHQIDAQFSIVKGYDLGGGQTGQETILKVSRDETPTSYVFTVGNFSMRVAERAIVVSAADGAKIHSFIEEMSAVPGLGSEELSRAYPAVCQ